MAKIIHTMIRVLDEERSKEFYEKAFGLTVADRYEFDSFVLIYLSNGEAEHELELTVNKDQDQPYEHGKAYGHMAFSVDDLDAAHRTCKEAGYSPKDIKTIEHNGRKLGKFFFIDDPDGYSIEVLERGGRFL